MPRPMVRVRDRAQGQVGAALRASCKHDAERRISPFRTECHILFLLYHLSQNRREKDVVLWATHSLPLVYPLPKTRRENVQLEEPHILSLSHTFPHKTGERNMQFFKLHISLCLSHTVVYKTAQRMWGSLNLMFSSCPALSPTNQERECMVVKTTYSHPLTYALQQDRRENVHFFEPHILSFSHLFSHKIGQRNVQFKEPHISLCFYHTVAYETAQRTRGLKNLTFSACFMQKI